MLTLSALAALRLAIAAVATTTPAGSAPVQVRTAADGAQLRFDPARNVYEMRAADGVAMLALWVPPGTTPVRGLFINGNPGGIGGDNRQFTRDRTFRAYAARLGFGLLGLHSMPGDAVRERLAARIFQALREFAGFGVHPELANLPFVSLGNSNGAATSYNLVNHAPERAICFAMNVGRMSQPPVDGALEVPGFIVIGPKDGLMRGKDTLEERLARVRKQVADARRRGARWAWLAEQNKGHEVGRIFDYQMAFFERCIAARLPALTDPNGDPRKGLVALKALPIAGGWLADDLAWERGLTPIAPYDAYSGDRSIASWLPDEALAILYRGLATYDSPIKLRFANLGEIRNENASGRFLTEVGGHVVRPGTQVELEVDLAGFPGWQDVAVHQGDRVIARATRATTGKDRITFAVRPDLSSMAFAYTAVARDSDGKVRTGIPVHLVVEDPRRPGLAPEPPVPPAPGSGTPTAPAGAAAAKTAGRLEAAALTSAEERGLRFGDGRVSPLWERLGERAATLALVPSHDRTSDASFSDDADATLRVRAAHGSAGVYFLFELDDDDAAEASSSDELNRQDAVALLLSSRSPEALWAIPGGQVFVNAGWSVALDAMELQSAFGGKRPPTHARIGWADPWEWRAVTVPYADLVRRRGVKIDVVRDGGRRAQEWFVPWRAVGRDGLAHHPGPGSSLAFSVGFNDQDPQRPVEGRSVAAFDRLRLGGKSPWYTGWLAGPNDTWGALILSPLPTTAAQAP